MVDVLLATYNGEKFLDSQIQSVMYQTCQDFHLYINDDCSTDNTVKIARKYEAMYPDKITVTVNEKPSGSAGANFFKMIKNSKADIIMTCDQDDIWDCQKIEITLEKFENVNTPLLVHSDLNVFVDFLKIISNSMWKYQHIDPTRNKLNNLLVQNTVTGCTMAFNRALADLIKIPNGIPVHDWYIAIIAAMYGKIEIINDKLVYYRQHDNNYCGAVNMKSIKYLWGRLKNFRNSEYMIELGYKIAREIVRLYNVDDPMIVAYSKMNRYNQFKRVYIVCKYHLWKSGVIRVIGQILFM